MTDEKPDAEDRLQDIDGDEDPEPEPPKNDPVPTGDQEDQQ